MVFPTKTCPTKTWRLLPHDAEAIARLARALDVSPIVAQLLLNRRVQEPTAARRFLQAPLSGLHEPECLPGVPEAVDRLVRAAQDKRRVCIYGDYDVDGVAGTAILLGVLRLIGAAVEFHIPNRIDEGYGLNAEALRKLAAAGVQVVVSIDCGISAVAEAEEARRLGLELIVTDHHEPKAQLPAADVVVHPRLPSTDYPFGQLSGAGVAFKLAWALAKRHCGSDKVTAPFREFLLEAVMLAALGAVADVVPLHDENRIFVRHGLARLRKNPPLGIEALLQCSGLYGKADLGAMDIGFGLAPRINAAGRLGTARLAVELLTTRSAERAGHLAHYLEEQNSQRQQLERRILSEAREMVEAGDGATTNSAAGNGDSALVLARQDWHPGLLGIVASRLVDIYGKPALMIALGTEHVCLGSGRSVPGLKLHEALEACTGHLLSHGGHATAAGFRVTATGIDAFRQHFCAEVARVLGPDPAPQFFVIDGEVPLSAFTTGVMLALAHLEPFGAGNPEPLFLAGDLQVVGQPKPVGGGERHLTFQVRQGGRYLRAIGFNMADRLPELMSEGGRLSAVFTPRFNEWQGMRRVEIEIKDFQSGPTARLAV